MKITSLRLFLFIVLVSLFGSTQSFGQYYYYNDKYFDTDWLFEIGGSTGAMFALTDVGRIYKKKKIILLSHRRFDQKLVKPNYTFYAGMMYQNTVGIRLEYTTGNIEGNDMHNTVESPRHITGLNFRSAIREVAAIGEFHPIMLKYYDDMPRFSPYIMAGIGVFSFKPEGNYRGQWIDLKPLNTEGQGFREYPDRQEYSLTAVSFPVGLGIKWEATAFFNLRAEVIGRFTTTDYIDDASQDYIEADLFYKYFNTQKAALATAMAERYHTQDPIHDYTNYIRGGKVSNDGYITFNLKLGIVLGREKIR